jgi:hypothetical protein
MTAAKYREPLEKEKCSDTGDVITYVYCTHGRRENTQRT